MTLLRVILEKIVDFFWPARKIVITPGQSVVIIGRPGSGKSTLLRWLLKNVESVVVYDSKYDPDEWPTQPDFIMVERASELGAYSRVVLHCKSEWLYNSDNWQIENHPWSIALEHPMKRGDTVAVFDEALATWPVRDSHPGTHRLIQQGRSFGVTVIVGSQLANNIDTRLLRMANHIFVLGPCKHDIELDALFRANHAHIQPIKELRKHQIAWWSDTSDHWTVFRALRFKRLNKLVQRYVHVPDRPSRYWLGFLFLTILLEIPIAMLGNHAEIAGNILILIYFIARIYKGKIWKVFLLSGSWIPVPIEEEDMIDNMARKRPPRSFRVT